jgi:glycosyltransferase involved in cell wall biosynthesis
VVLYLGAMSSEKRPDLAVAVAALMPEVQVVLAGPGVLPAAVSEAARQAGVIVTGPVHDAARALAAADAVLLCSDTEGLPGVLIEAGMAGRPAAATAVGFVDEVVLDGRTGRLAAAGDAEGLAAAARECLARAADWGAAAREHCLSRFGAPVVVPAWERLLLDVAAGTAHASIRSEAGWEAAGA